MDDQLLYIHAKPYVDESCFSWLLRTAELHALTAAELLRTFNVVKRRDLDLAINPRIVARFTKGIDFPFDTVRQMSKFFEAFRTEKWTHAWIKVSSLGMPLLGYCPYCLEQDEQPYWRSTWRLKYWTVCPSHYCPILNTCMACERALSAFHYHGRRPVQAGISLCGRCSNCMAELSYGTAGSHCYPQQQVQDLVDLQNVVTAALVRGWFRVAGIDSELPLALLPSILIAGGTRANELPAPVNRMAEIQIREAMRSLIRGGTPGFFIGSRSEFVSVGKACWKGPAQRLAEEALWARFSLLPYAVADST